MNITSSGSGSGSGSGIVELFTCTDPSTFSSNSISNETVWTIRSDIADNGGIPTSIVLGVIWIVAFSWNLFILVTYCYKYHLLKYPANVFLFALAFTDFLVSVTTLPGTVITFAAGEFIIGMTDKVRCDFCYLQGFLIVFCPVVSITILAILSMDRCFLLYKPLVYKKKENSAVAVLVVIIVYIFSFFLCVLPAFGFGEWEFNKNIGACIARFTPTDNLFFLFVIVVYCLIPCILLGITNIWTYKIVSKFLRRRLVRRRSYRGSRVERNEDNASHHQQQTQLVKVFGALFIANIVIWSPVIVMVFVLFIVDSSKVPGWPYVIFWIIVSSNSVVHPILESFFNKELRLVVNKGKKNFGSTLRSTSRTLVRMVTTDSMRSETFNEDDDDTPKKTKRGESSFANSTTMTSELASSPTAGFKFTPDIDRKFSTETPDKSRVRQIGCPPSPLITRHTSPVFNFTTNGSGSPGLNLKRNISLSNDANYISNTITLSNSVEVSPRPTGSPRTPLTPGKRRQVSIALPDNDNVFYPSRARTPTLMKQDPVFEDDDDETMMKETDTSNTRGDENSSDKSEEQHSLDTPSKHSSSNDTDNNDPPQSDDSHHDNNNNNYSNNGILISEIVNNIKELDHDDISDDDDDLV